VRSLTGLLLPSAYSFFTHSLQTTILYIPILIITAQSFNNLFVLVCLFVWLTDYKPICIRFCGIYNSRWILFSRFSIHSSLTASTPASCQSLQFSMDNNPQRIHHLLSPAYASFPQRNIYRPANFSSLRRLNMLTWAPGHGITYGDKHWLSILSHGLPLLAPL